MTPSPFSLTRTVHRAWLLALGLGALCLIIPGPSITSSCCWASGSAGAAPSGRADASVPLVINGVEVDAATRGAFEARYGLLIPGGRYWYDRLCGAWGWEGGPTAGFTLPGLSVGGALSAAASGGGPSGMLTGVFVNGRELHPLDVLALAQLVPVSPGRFWLDSAGNAGYEGGAAVVNLWQVARRSGTGGAYQRATAGGYIGGDGQTSYFFDPETGSSVMVGN